MDSETFEEFAYDKLDSIEAKSELLSGAKIIFYHESAREKIAHIQEGNIEQFVAKVQEKIG
ncbi:hypothetical protein LYSBPC_19460 [Lysinibacillus piscis]|uniref:YokE-like PH domain-containing protein n=2 Tax=Lysinibacillus piscis TaxID=2518931 RepID=A0ABQ5NLA5_9BACI|nr:hypothetical protein LYSBPC_19460 [Lysinibacillus sp. KH24]